MMKMEKKRQRRPQKKKEVDIGLQLLDVVFSWSFKHVLNNHHFLYQVKEIPETFDSIVNYLNSFLYPLIEETRAEFCSALERVAEAPECEITHLQLKKYKGPNRIFYEISTKRIQYYYYYYYHNNKEYYRPKSGDVILITNYSSLEQVEHLIDAPAECCCLLAYVLSGRLGKYVILPSMEIDAHVIAPMRLQSMRVFATYVMNLTTNMRIWRALKYDPQSSKLSLIQTLLNSDSSDELNECTSLCFPEENNSLSSLISSFNLDESQKSAIFSSISKRKCSHNTTKGNKVKLIWGPPGTGKTKTVASLLFALLQLKCRTLTCAPTSIAVVQVAKRLMGLVLKSETCCRLGDIVLFGNGKRMKIDENDDLSNVFLSNRVKILTKSITDWKPSLKSMIALLSDPEKRYNKYRKVNLESNDANEGKKEENRTEFDKRDPQNSRNNRRKVKSEIHLLTFEEFMEKNFYSLAEILMLCANNFYTHLPSSCITLEVEKDLIALIDQLKKLESARKDSGFHYEELLTKKNELVDICTHLYSQKFPEHKGKLWNFCMSNACLIFCTAISSIKVKSNVEMVIIDEAAQLKESKINHSFKYTWPENSRSGRG